MSFTYSPKIVTDGLVFYVDAANPNSYVSGNTTVDSLVSNVTGSLINDTDFSPDNQGSWVFDGVGDRITFDSTESTINNIGPKSTCNIWIKYDTTGYAVLIGGSSYSNGGYFFWANPSGAYSSYMASYDLASWTSFGTGVWINYCVTKNDSGNVIWYGNGQQLGTGTVNAASSIGFWSIGSYFNGGYSFNGNISNVQVYNRALSSDEVLQNYNALKGRFGL